MTMTERTPGSPPDVDTLLRTTLPDDLPPDLEARLHNRIERFLLDRRSRAGRSLAAVPRFAFLSARADAWRTVRVLHVAASAALVVCGIALNAVGGPGLFAASMLRMNESVTLWETVRRASSMRCTGVAQDDFGSPADLADRVYRRWVLVSSAFAPTEAAMVLTFESPGERAQYELVVDPRSKLPRRVVKTWLSGATPRDDLAKGYDATCTWEMSDRDEEPSAAETSRTGR
jgi:hypothetical protein